MKKLILLTLLLWPSMCFLQIERAQEYKKETRLEYDSLTNQLQPVTYFVLRDTIGDPASGNYSVKVSSMDSSSFILFLYGQALEQFTGVGNAEGSKASSLYFGNLYRSQAAKIMGQDLYANWARSQLRPALQGQYSFRKGQTNTRLTADNKGNFLQEGALRLRVHPLSPSWLVAVDNQASNEQIELYRIESGLYVGTSTEGRVILKKL